MINVETDYLCLRITELGISCISVVLNSVFVIFKTFFLVGCTCKLLKNILYNFDAFNMTVIYNCTNFACWFAITSVEVLSFVLHCAHIDLHVLFVYIQKLYFWYDYIWTLVTQFIGPDIILMLSIMAGRRMLAENNIATTHIDRFCKWDYVLHRSNCFEWICYCSNVLLFFRLLFQWLDCTWPFLVLACHIALTRPSILALEGADAGSFKGFEESFDWLHAEELNL